MWKGSEQIQGTSQSYLPDCSKLPEDIIHLLGRDVEGQISHVQDPASKKGVHIEAVPEGAWK